MIKVITKEGKKATEDDSRSGRPVEASSKEMWKKKVEMISQDSRVKVSVTAGTVSSIIHSVLMMSRVSSRWVPRAESRV